jgi:hypothetical protein
LKCSIQDFIAAAEHKFESLKGGLLYRPRRSRHNSFYTLLWHVNNFAWRHAITRTRLHLISRSSTARCSAAER